MEASSVEHAADEPPEINAAAAATEGQTAALFLAPLLAMAAQASVRAPSPGAAGAGREDRWCWKASASGARKDTPPRVIIGKEWWDGVSQGVPPTLYNAVMVTPRDAQQTPPLWQTHIVMSGTLHVTRDPA